MFTIAIKTGNAAFHDQEEGYYDYEVAVGEIERILKETIERLHNGQAEGACIDYNGNKVGDFKLDL